MSYLRSYSGGRTGQQIALPSRMSTTLTDLNGSIIGSFGTSNECIIPLVLVWQWCLQDRSTQGRHFGERLVERRDHKSLPGGFALEEGLSDHADTEAFEPIGSDKLGIVVLSKGLCGNSIRVVGVQTRHDTQGHGDIPSAFAERACGVLGRRDGNHSSPTRHSGGWSEAVQGAAAGW